MKRAVPIIASSPKYLGLTVPEWALSLLPLILFTTIFNKVFLIYLPAHLIVMIIYIVLFSKMEENIVPVVVTWFKIPEVIIGIFNKSIIQKRPICAND